MPVAISREATDMVSVPVRTWLTSVRQLAFMFFIACISWPVSFCECTSICCVRSPAATLSASLTASFSGREMARISQRPINAASSTPQTTTATEILRTRA